MHGLQLLLAALSAQTAAAIDIYLHNNYDCNGDGLICRGNDPDRCCATHKNSAACVAFHGIPDNWNLGIRGHHQDYCGNVVANGQSGYNSVWARLRSGTIGDNSKRFSGAGYSIIGIRGKRRGVEPESGDCPANPQEGQCTPVKPNVLALADGTEFHIADMEARDLEELETAMAATGYNSTVADIPVKFLHLKI